MRVNRLLIVLNLVLILAALRAVSADDINIYHTLDAKAAGLAGVRYVKPVIINGLFRGGGAGGTKPLTPIALESLCRAGFSSAIYTYPNGYKKQTIDCTANGEANTLVYEQGGFRDQAGRRKSLEIIHQAITAQKPAFVHCWNGWHASGEVAAIALMQFCGWSGAQAGAYWAKNIGDQGNIGKYGSIYKKHIPNFVPFEDLKISSSLQSEICPQP